MRLLSSRCALAVALLAAAVPAYAESSRDDTWRVTASGLFADIDLSARARADITATDGVDTFTDSFSTRGNVSEDANGGQLSVTWRPTDRQSWRANWARVTGSSTQSDAGAFVVPGAPPQTIDYDYRVRSSTDFDLYSLGWGYDLWQGDTTTLTGVIAVYGAKLDTRVSGTGSLTDGVDTATGTGSEGYSATRHAPGLGLTGRWQVSDRVTLSAGFEGFETSWGNFSQDGYFTNAQARAEYRFKDNWIAHVGYDWFRLDLEDRETYTGTIGSVDYTADTSLRGRLDVSGPIAGVTWAF